MDYLNRSGFQSFGCFTRSISFFGLKSKIASFACSTFANYLGLDTYCLAYKQVRMELL